MICRDVADFQCSICWQLAVHTIHGVLLIKPIASLSRVWHFRAFKRVCTGNVIAIGMPTLHAVRCNIAKLWIWIQEMNGKLYELKDIINCIVVCCDANHAVAHSASGVGWRQWPGELYTNGNGGAGLAGKDEIHRYIYISYTLRVYVLYTHGQPPKPTRTYHNWK